jgi:hypothetical protein
MTEVFVAVRQIHILTDHKPFVAAFRRVLPPWSARQQRQLSCGLKLD